MEKDELKKEIKRIKKYYTRNHSYFTLLITRNINLFNYRLLKYYYLYNSSKSKILKFLFYRKYAKYSRILNVQINCKNILIGFLFEHQNIVINHDAVIGQNLFCYGNNCIGGHNGAPIIGDNCVMGYGSTIIGKVRIEDNVVIGASSIITKDITKKGSVVVGQNRIIK